MQGNPFEDDPFEDASQPNYLDDFLKKGVPIQADSFELDYLNSLLNKGGCDDRSLIAGAEFTHQGYIKLANAMSEKLGKHISLKDIQMMINELMEKLRSDHHQMVEDYEEVLDENDERYSYEADFLGNVTIRDDQTGDEKYIQGSDASSLMNDLDSTVVDSNKQHILAQYMNDDNINEAFEPEDLDSYEPEIESKMGTYNFPWKSGNSHGTATAEYSGKGKISVISVRDENGDAVKMTPNLDADLHRQAVEFIGDA